MEDWEDGAAETLERLTASSMADAYVGTVRILSLTPPTQRRRYQTCTMELALQVPELEGETLRTEVVLDKRYWPEVGVVLRARISRRKPRMIDADWDALARR
ncbi:hypothetical protein QSU92_09600 [Microbacterium sp. ET2]|uniref:hypothetical protein n=1 Tax=Microbacterium albipurpureum TaxID=3050384 RepID=UPI00259CC044|nr:hypothetical protein [Microbacterium sp. ET2 (Ac-2212)]WJL94253.1 hypothetical protein QSU92_09600 [Microbacterium sp. ET2 (Ac-2212)]